MIGWRVGWVVGPDAIMEQVRQVAISDVVTPVGIAQAGAAAALAESSQSIAGYIAEWQRRRDTLLDELRGWPAIPPQGGWSLLMDVAALGFDAPGATRRLFEIGRIACTPMTGWGSERSARYVRFVYSNEPCERMRGVRERVARALSSGGSPR